MAAVARTEREGRGMNAVNKLVTRVSSFVHGYFLWLLLACYAAAALVPGVGLWIRDISFGEISLFQQRTSITLPMLMLALLLLNAGLGLRSSQLKGLPRVALLLFVGLIANLAVPVALIF